MGLSFTNPKQAAIPFFGHKNILHMLVSVASTALAAGVVLPGMVAWIMGVQCLCEHFGQKRFLYHQMYHSV